MRKLTIHRKKRFVASLVTLKVYIEDPTTCDLVIGELPCRKLGEIKNGETATFEIGENAARVFVIADRLSKGYCNEYYKIPAGNEDVELFGKNEFNPATGNAFRFDGVTDPEVLANRKKGKGKGRVVLVTAILVGMIAGFFIGVIATSEPVEEQTFTKDDVTITLTNEFQEQTMDGFAACWGSVDVAVFVREDSFAEEPDLKNYSVEQYAEQLYKLNRHEVPKGVQTEGGLTFYEYQHHNPDDGITYCYFTYIYKTESGFWIVQFATPNLEVENYRESIAKWANSVEFAA